MKQIQCWSMHRAQAYKSRLGMGVFPPERLGSQSAMTPVVHLSGQNLLGWVKLKGLRCMGRGVNIRVTPFGMRYPLITMSLSVILQHFDTVHVVG